MDYGNMSLSNQNEWNCFKDLMLSTSLKQKKWKSQLSLIGLNQSENLYLLGALSCTFTVRFHAHLMEVEMAGKKNTYRQ